MTIEFDKITPRQLRKLLFDLDNQDLPLFNYLFNCVNERNRNQSITNQAACRLLYNYLYGVNTTNIICKVCGSQSYNSYYDTDNFTNVIRFNHLDDDNDYYCCLFYFDDKDKAKDDFDEVENEQNSDDFLVGYKFDIDEKMKKEGK